MKSAKSFIIPCLLFFLSSCASVDTTIVKYQTFNPAYSWIQEPPAGKPVQAEEGQTITVESLAAIFDGFISKGRYEIHIPDDVTLFPKSISPEDEYIIWGSLPNGDVVVRNMAFARAVRSDRESGKLELVLIAHRTGEVYGYASFARDQLAIGKLTPTIKLHPQQVSVAGDFRQELVYQGKKENIIKFESLEYLDDMATPVSKQDLTYDLAKSKTIACKGVLMDITEATEHTITFVIKRYLISP